MAQITINKLDTQDRPITSSKEDKLDRSKIVNSIIDAIDSPDSPDGKHSLTIGIEGPWGSGKTSIINLVKDKIESDKDHKDKYVILDFNPWMHMGTEQILIDFFRSISQAIMKGLPDKPEISEKAQGLLTGITISLNLGPFSAQKNFDAKLDEPTLDKQKKDLADTLSGLDKKVVCIIDDIDRLDVDETLLIFKLTKIIADFPNMVFLLAYDRQRTSELISQKFNVNNSEHLFNEVIGDLYIRKIIQVVRPVPYSNEEIRREYFIGLVRDARLYKDISDKEYMPIKDTFQEHIKNILHTPRDMKRLIYHIDLFLSINKISDIYIKDLLLIEAIRMSETRVHEKIKDSRAILLDEDYLSIVETNSLNSYLAGDASDKTLSGVPNTRVRNIIRIAEASSDINRVSMIRALQDILSCHPNNYSPKKNQGELYQYLCKRWDLYFSAGTASGDMDR